jgi:hypothetical protein
MNATLRDKAWARRFASKCGGDLGITHAGPSYKVPFRYWKPSRIPTITRMVRDCPQADEPWREVVQAVTVPKSK